jgi:hypothetical protein
MTGIPPTPQPPAPGVEANSELRDTFVEMLFALVVAEIAIKFADLVTNQLTNWSSVPAYTHLAIALALVSASWVGWKRSRAPGKRQDVVQIFSLPFVVLIIDVWLVICYFIIARGVEIEPKSVGSNILVVNASATNETTWVMITFGSYAVWDFISNAIPKISKEGKSFFRSWHEELFIGNGWVTLLCLFLAFLGWLLFKNFSHPGKVVLVDLSLISLIFLFRAIKQGDRLFTRLLTLGTIFPLSFLWAIQP